MADLIKGILDFLNSKENTTAVKYIWALLGIILLFIANDITGFTTYYSTQKGLEVAKDASELLKEDSLSSKTILLLKVLLILCENIFVYINPMIYL